MADFNSVGVGGKDGFKPQPDANRGANPNVKLGYRASVRESPNKPLIKAQFDAQWAAHWGGHWKHRQKIVADDRRQRRLNLLKAMTFDRQGELVHAAAVAAVPSGAAFSCRLVPYTFDVLRSFGDNDFHYCFMFEKDVPDGFPKTVAIGDETIEVRAAVGLRVPPGATPGFVILPDGIEIVCDKVTGCGTVVYPDKQERA